MPVTALDALINLNVPGKTGAAQRSSDVPNAGDASNENSFTTTGTEIVVVDNTGASARTISFGTGSADVGVEYSVPANEMAVFGPFNPNLYPDGVVQIDPAHAELVFAVVDLSSNPENILTR